MWAIESVENLLFTLASAAVAAALIGIVTAPVGLF
jgi:hypothetical protein